MCVVKARKPHVNCPLKVGKCVPPRVIMPLTTEPSKPRLCHDERYLDLWVTDSPLHLETLRDIPRMVLEVRL